MKNFHLLLISLVVILIGLNQNSLLIWIPGAAILAYSLVAYLIFFSRETCPRVWAEVVQVQDANNSHFLVKIHAKSAYVYFSYYTTSAIGFRVRYETKEKAEGAANEYISKHLNPKGRKTLVVSTLDIQNQIPALNLPPTAEDLVNYVNKMSDEEYKVFSNLLENNGQYPLRTLPPYKEKDLV